MPLRAASMEKAGPVDDDEDLLVPNVGGSMRRKGESEERFLERIPMRLCLGEQPAGADDGPEGNVNDEVLVVVLLPGNLPSRGDTGVLGLTEEWLRVLRVLVESLPDVVLRVNIGRFFFDGVPSGHLERLADRREGSTFSESFCSSSKMGAYDRLVPGTRVGLLLL